MYPLRAFHAFLIVLRKSGAYGTARRSCRLFLVPILPRPSDLHVSPFALHYRRRCTRASEKCQRRTASAWSLPSATSTPSSATPSAQVRSRCARSLLPTTPTNDRPSCSPHRPSPSALAGHATTFRHSRFRPSSPLPLPRLLFCPHTLFSLATGPRRLGQNIRNPARSDPCPFLFPPLPSFSPLLPAHFLAQPARNCAHTRHARWAPV